VGLSRLLFREELLALMKNHPALEGLLFSGMNLDRLVCAVNHLKVYLNAAVFQPSDSPPVPLGNFIFLPIITLATSLL
jgi:hypothetical protein